MKQLRIIYTLLSCLLIVSCSREKKGCMDPNALNYDEQAVVDNGKCEYEPAIKKSILLFFGGTSCSTCGSFAYPIFKEVVAQSSSFNVIPMVVFSTASDPLFSGAAVSLANVYQITGLPDIAVGTANNLLTKQAVINAINAENSIMPLASLGLTYAKDINVLNIELSGKFEQATSGQIFVAAYVLENGIIQSQVGDGDPNFVHNYVLRTSTGTSGIGTEIAEGQIAKDFSFKQNFQVIIDSTWDASNLKVVAAIWRKDAEGYHFINAAN